MSGGISGNGPDTNKYGPHERFIFETKRLHWRAKAIANGVGNLQSVQQQLARTYAAFDALVQHMCVKEEKSD